MRRVLLTVIISLLCICLVACNTNSKLLEDITRPPDEEKEEPPEKELDPAEADEPEVATPEPTVEATPEPTQSPEPENNEKADSLSFAHADLVYADPEAYKGQEYASPFMILTEPAWIEDVLVCYAVGFSNTDMQTYTALNFKGEAPELAVDEAIYVRGTIGGEGYVFDDNGNTVDLLWLDVEEVEKELVISDAEHAGKDIGFDDGEFVAKSDTLSIEVISLSFEQNTMFLSTKTIDEAAEEFTTYYLDIIMHQDGYFAWYHDCNFWIDKGIEGFDNVPFPIMQTDQNITIEFVPFSEDGKLLYEPLVIDLELGYE